MLTINLTKNTNDTDFSVVRIIEDKDSYYAEIRVNPNTHRIKLKSEDYLKIFSAVENNKIIKIFPLQSPKGYLIEISKLKNKEIGDKR